MKSSLNLLLLLLLLGCVTFCHHVVASEPQVVDDSDIGELLIKDKRSFEDMKKARMVRVLVTYNSSNYFVSDGRQHGLEYELMRRFEESLNVDRKKADEQIHVSFISVPFDKLMPYLVQGYGDIAAAGLTVTPERQQHVEFSAPYRTNVSEILVSGPNAEPVESLLDLAGKKVHVVKGSSYAGHLKRLNAQFEVQGIRPVEVVELTDSLEAEDILEMINAGIFNYTFVDNFIAELWQSVLPHISVRDSVVLNKEGDIAWAIRKDDPGLKTALDKFIGKHREGTLLGNVFFKRYFKETKWIKNPLTASRRKKLDKYIELFKKYGEQYDFDPILLGAIAFQESGIRQNLKSRAGAVGVMQIKPSTAADRNVGITGVATDAEKNIHAGTKYLAFLRSRYFSSEDLSPEARYDFTIAAYNAGPGNIRKFRREAEKAGLDPNQWFFNVEHIARKRLGRETVQYVANVNKYYVAYRSMIQQRTAKEQGRSRYRE